MFKAIESAKRNNESTVLKDSEPTYKGGEELQSAFIQFIEATRELESSQRELSAQVLRLTGDLAKSNAELKQEITAKGRLAEDLAALLSALPTGVIILQHRRVYAFNEVSAKLVSELSVGDTWQLPKGWTALDEAHFRTNTDQLATVVRPESRPLSDDREMVLLHDVTATFRAREQAERESKLAAMGRMTAEIAHQLRTPLATAMLYASHLSRDSLDEEKRHRFVEHLIQQLNGLDGIVGRMMSFLRTRTLSSEIISVEELLHETKSSCIGLFEAHGVVLRLSIDGGTHLLTVQRDQLRGGILSILENALSVSPFGAAVSITAYVQRSRLVILIEDEGPGISESMKTRLFEPFATGSPKGTGLGLAIAKAAIEAHRGEVHAANRRERGAVFQIVLPVLEPL